MSLLKNIFGKRPPKLVNFVNDDISFEVSSSETILEKALKEGVKYPHDCTVGTCGACRTKLISGKVEAITPFEYALSKGEIKDGYILACQALAKSSVNIEVELVSSDMVEPSTHSAKLKATELLTHDIKKVTWSLDAPLKWWAGQYINVKWNNSTDHRSYSFAQAPSADGKKEIVIYMRHVPGGTLTDQFFPDSPTALEFEINGPHGNFWLRDGNGPIVCVAGGSGLAPIVSLLQDAANRKVRRDVVVLFGARTQDDIYGQKELSAIRNKWTAGFAIWNVLSEEKNDEFRQGWVTDYIKEALDKLGDGAQGYFCGPPPMIDAGIERMTECGISLDDIFYDKFTDQSNL